MFVHHPLSSLLCSAGTLLITSVSIGRSQILKIWPDEQRGSRVTYGRDVKLTMWRIINNDAVDVVNQRFANDLKMDLVGVSMVAIWGAYGNKHTLFGITP